MMSYPLRGRSDGNPDPIGPIPGRWVEIAVRAATDTRLRWLYDHQIPWDRPIASES